MAILTTDTRRVMLVALALAVAAGPALAQDFSPVDNLFVTVGTWLTTTAARALGLIGVAVIGFIAMRGKIDWGYAFSVMIGIVIVLGAGKIMAGFGTT